jgi:membrane protease YdiL (CAAX protease family)
MNAKTIFGYLTVLFLSFLPYVADSLGSAADVLLPLSMLIYPLMAGHRVKLRFSAKDILVGFAVSLALLSPYYLLLEGNIQKIGIQFVFLQLVSVAFPEEFFFRGFLQDSLGRNMKSVLLVSFLFGLAHLPRAMFLGDWIALLSFFPSLVMGWLFLKTNNIVPATIFHLLANLAYFAASPPFH